MRIAFYSDEEERFRWGREHFKRWIRRICGLEVDCYQELEQLFTALERLKYDMVMIYTAPDSYNGRTAVGILKEQKREILLLLLFGEVSRLLGITQKKYISCFNGNLMAVDFSDISFLESFDRKTYMVTEKGRMRVGTKLDVEEQKLPAAQFARISQGNIVNMNQIRSVCGERIRMKTGEVLYPSVRRKKTFLEKYFVYFLGLSTET